LLLNVIRFIRDDVIVDALDVSHINEIRRVDTRNRKEPVRGSHTKERR
jgi:hypothetical protein